MNLADRIARGPVPVAEALSAARELAVALEAVHERGVTRASAADVGIDFSQFPMSPESARGLAVGRPADIWAFGCILYQLLTGRRPEGDPDWTTLPAATPASIKTLLRRCLAQDPRKRVPHIGAARIEIDEAATMPPTGWGVTNRSARGRGASWLVAITCVMGALLAVWAPWRTPVSASPVRLSADLGTDAELVTSSTTRGPGGAAATISPDGSHLAFIAQDHGGRWQIYVRSLADLRAVPLAGTDGPHGLFFSPDGKWVGFQADGKLKKIAVGGGAAVTLTDAQDPRGATWGDDDKIIFAASTGGGLSRVSSAGGKAERLGALQPNEVTQRWPQLLPGARAVIYTSNTHIGDINGANIVAQPLPSGVPQLVMSNGTYGRYVASGHLVFVRDGTLFAVPFDPQRLEVRGQPVPVLESVSVGAATGAAQFDVSKNGTLVYLPGNGSNDVPLQWVDRDGKTTPLQAAASKWANARLSPDGRRLAVVIVDGTQSDIWIHDLERDEPTRLTFDRSASNPVWTPDGRRIVYASARGASGTRNIYWQRVDGTGDVERLTESSNEQRPGAWHPNGRLLAFTEGRQSNDLMILPVEGDEASGWKPGKPTVWLEGPAHDSHPSFSPDGQWLAYASSSGADAFGVFVRPFPSGAGKWLVSSNGFSPLWSRTRQELLFPTTDDHIAIAAYSVEGKAFRPEKQRTWTDARFVRRRAEAFNMSPDGERVLIAKVPEAETALQRGNVTLIFNFFDELRRLAPPK